MQEGVRLANKEVEYLEFMINFKEIGLEKRDVMLSKYMEQMTQMHEELKALKIHNNKLQQKVNSFEGVNKRQSVTLLHQHQLLLEQQQKQQKQEQELNNSRRQSAQPYSKNNQSQNVIKRNDFNIQINKIKKPAIPFAARSSHMLLSTSPMNQLESLNLEEINKSDDQITIPISVRSTDRQMKQDIIDSITPKSNLSRLQTPKTKTQTPKNVLSVGTNKANQRRLSNFSHSISVQIVTNTQGLQEDEVLFRNDQESNSLMEKGEEDLLINKKFRFLEKFFENHQRFFSQIFEMKEQQQKQLLKVVNLALSDLKRFFSLSLRYKELLNVTSEIAKYTSFDHAFDMILKKIVTSLRCDTASIFLVDETSQELWTVANKQGNTIRFPLTENSIAGYCIKHEIAMNVFDAYQDSRFNKQIDFDTGYRTKTILCVPIKDEKNQVVGCLEAINKHSEFFNKQDQEMLEIIGNFCSSILRNSLKFDKLLIQRDYYKRLINISNFIQDNNKIHKMMIEAEEKMKELIGSNICKIYVLQREGEVVNLLNYVKGAKEPKVIKNLKTGILHQVIKTHKQQTSAIPKENGFYDNSVDIDTSLPLVTVPIFNKEHSQLIGVYQAENVKGFLQKHFGKDEDFQSNPESLALFAEMIGNAIQKYSFFSNKIAQFQQEFLLNQQINRQKEETQ